MNYQLSFLGFSYKKQKVALYANMEVVMFVFWFLAKSWVQRAAQWSPNVLQLKQLAILRIKAAPAKCTVEYIWGMQIQLYNDSRL